MTDMIWFLLKCNIIHYMCYKYRGQNNRSDDILMECLIKYIVQVINNINCSLPLYQIYWWMWLSFRTLANSDKNSPPLSE
jgi:hypothetical protein